MPDPDPSATFRQQATTVFGVVMVTLVVIAFGLAALGWRLGRWWGLAVGAGIGILLLIAALVGGGLLYAMTQDGG